MNLLWHAACALAFVAGLFTLMDVAARRAKR